jgi:hypothetical protein
MDIDKIISELQNEVRTIDEAIAALQRLLPNSSEERAANRSARPSPKKEE